MVWSPEILMRNILSQIHYMPEHWKGQAHKFPVRDEFSQLFQYKFVSKKFRTGKNLSFFSLLRVTYWESYSVL